MASRSIDFPHKKLFIRIFEDKVYLVGGSVRDFLIHRTINPGRDIDLVVEDHTYTQIEKKLKPFGKTNTVGKSFAVIKFTVDQITYDISVPRRDRLKDSLQVSHKNFSIESGPHVTLREDLGRRDFTCNSIAWRLVDGQLIDPFDGAAAIKAKKILMTGADTFFDDPLRILRCARFASVLEFSVEPLIYENARDLNLKGLSKERVLEELFRMLLESSRPAAGLKEYFRLTVLKQWFPELYRLTLTIQDALFHPEADEFGHHTVWAHTLLTVDVARRCCDIFKLGEMEALALLLAALFHDLGKAQTTGWEYKKGRMTITSIFHDTRGMRIADKVFARFNVETRMGYPLRRVVLNLIKNHHRIFELYRNREKISFKAVARLVRDLEGADFLLVLLDFADRQSREKDFLNFSELDEISQWILLKKDEYNLNQETIRPIVMGRDLLGLGMPPGKEVGTWLKILYEHQLNGEFTNVADGLKLYKNLRKGKSVFSRICSLGKRTTFHIKTKKNGSK